MTLYRWIHLLGAVLAVNLVKGLPVVAAAFVIMHLVKRMNSETRHLIWFWVICSFVLLPLAWFLVPPVQVGAVIPEESATAYRVAVSPVLSREAYVELVEKWRRIEALRQPGQPSVVRRFWALLLAAWLGGILLLTVRLVVGRSSLKRLGAAASADRKVQTILNDTAKWMSMRRQVRVLLSTRCSIPFTFGCWRPLILLPTSASVWPLRKLRSVLIHEMGHIRRQDVLTQSIAYSICLVFWFIAPIWFAFAAMVREAETCCDRFVVNQGIRRTQYASYIVGLAQTSRGRLLLPCIAGTIRRKSMLMHRVKKVLSLKPTRVSSGIRGTVKLLIVCLVCLFPLAVVTCATKPAVVVANDPLYGIWLNPEYGGLRADTYARWEIFPDGRELRYINDSDPKPNCEMRDMVIAETWVDSERNRWYKGYYSQSLYPYAEEMVHVFWMRKLNATGTTLEFVGSEARYPAEMSRIGGEYFIHYKATEE